MKDTARFYKNTKGAQIFIGKKFAEEIGFSDKEKLLIEYNATTKILSLRRL